MICCYLVMLTTVDVYALAFQLDIESTIFLAQMHKVIDSDRLEL